MEIIKSAKRTIKNLFIYITERVGNTKNSKKMTQNYWLWIFFKRFVQLIWKRLFKEKYPSYAVKQDTFKSEINVNILQKWPHGCVKCNCSCVVRTMLNYIYYYYKLCTIKNRKRKIKTQIDIYVVELI